MRGLYFDAGLRQNMSRSRSGRRTKFLRMGFPSTIRRGGFMYSGGIGGFNGMARV